MSNKKIGLIAGLAALAASGVMAGTLTNYTTGDVLLCFRKPGANDLVVNAAPIATLTALSPNQRYTISAYTGAQLGQIGTNGVSWSAFTWLADDTLYVTRPRTSLNTQTAPWLAKSSFNQHATDGRMAQIVVGAAENYGAGLNNPLSSSSAVIEEDISSGNANYLNGLSYRDALFGSYGGNFNGTFQGNPENTTLANFTASGKVVRSDFYRLTPTGGFAQGVWMGYFELNTNGVMTYVAYPSATPVLKTPSRSGNVTSIDYVAGLYGTYTLRATNSAGLKANWTNWPAIATLTSGDTAVHTVTDTTTATDRFYIITAQ